MELIPILSLIILVATIATFILAVGAYILYKVRENKGLIEDDEEVLVPAEFVTPFNEEHSIQQKKEFEEGGFIDREPLFVSKRKTIPSTIHLSKTKQRFTTLNDQSKEEKEKIRLKSERFSKFINEDESDQEKDVNANEDKLRWR